MGLKLSPALQRSQSTDEEVGKEGEGFCRQTFSRNKGSPQDLKQTSTYGELRILQQGVKGTQSSFERWRQGRTRFCATLDFPSFRHMEAIEGSEEGGWIRLMLGNRL